MHVLYAGLVISGLFAIGVAYKMAHAKDEPEAFADEQTMKTMAQNIPHWKP